MTIRITTLDVRQGLGDLLNKVVLRHDEFVIERKGKSLAALIPIEKLQSCQRIAKRHALEFLEQQKNGDISEDGAMETAVAAQHEGRTANDAGQK